MHRKNLILATAVFWFSLYSAPFENRLSWLLFDSPFFHSQNPSLLSFQKYGPAAGAAVYLDSAYSFLGIQELFAVYHLRDAYSFSHTYTSGNVHEIGTSFSRGIGISYFGGNVSLLFDRTISPQFTFGGAGSAVFKNETAVSVIIRNILQYRAFSSLPRRGADLFVSKNFAGFYFDLNPGLIIHDIDPFVYEYSVRLSVERDLFSSMVMCGRGGIVYDTANVISPAYSVRLGFSKGIGSTRAGMMFSYEYFREQATLAARAVYNFNFGRDRISPKVRIELSDSTIRFENSDGRPEVLISIFCRDNTDGVGIRRWSLIIANDRIGSSRIIRTFSGGGIPPATISWDGRDAFGNIEKPARYFIRLLAVDKNGNVGVTGWKRIYLLD